MLDSLRTPAGVVLFGSALLAMTACHDGGSSNVPTAAAPAAPPAATPTPAPVESTIEFSSTDVPKDIPNGTRTLSTLNITTTGTIVEVVSVSVNISHTWRGDLDVRLRHPDGTLVDLYIGNPRDSRDDVVETFTLGTTPGLQGLVNKQVAGTWTLVVDDTQLQDKGRLHGWSMRLRIRR
jgi:subtilisin-like proprotein convertase family protein